MKRINSRRGNLSRRIVGTVSMMIILFTFLPVWAMGNAPEAIPSPVSGRTAIDFTLPDLDGKPVKLSDYRGKVVFLNFWATWCPPCREEMPSIQRLHDQLGGKNFAILAVAIDTSGKAAVAPFIKKGNYSFKVLLDPGQKAAARYQVMSIPTTYIIDSKGKMVDKIIGSREWTQEAVLKYIR